ncbi:MULTISPECIES: hypothetical protein [unclassified Gilliamella]|uniref:hypothetical protein n=1 Tax=unclassified Gilliamella TaxID=2685620 RepID=UPI001306C7E4|nr:MULTISPECIES: hypothetical protein [unclassified Gilliamella]MWP49332.1 hypothetical protein [Gilliamella sp. Lep-s35]MWP68956.1 hypothetical protein [Gilliamella sp. Lep-s5]MWP77323.1 hypothetical protein [Gilliamella sp. Lep-s21]
MKKSFFKLPLLLVLFYWIFNIVFVITYSVGFDEYFFISSDMTTYQISRKFIKRILLNFFLQLPSSLVLFITSVLILNKYAINQINQKNIVNSLFIVALITLGDIVGRLYCYTYIYECMQFGRQYLNPNIYFFLLNNITNFLKIAISYFFIILLTYLGIKLFNKSYTHNDNALTQKESQQLHLGLFIVLYNCCFLTTLFALIFLDKDMYYSFKNIIINIVGLTVFLSIVNLFGYFLLRRCFTGVTETLALRRLIFSSMGIFILNCLLLSGLIMFNVLLARYLNYLSKISELKIVIIWFVMAVILFISSCVLVRIAVKLLFGKMDKNHQSI